MKLIVKWINILYVSSGKAIKLSVQQVHTGKSHIISAAKYLSSLDKVVHGRSELDSHSDTTVAGANSCLFQYTGKKCDVSPYSDDYEAIKGVPIVHATIAWQSPDTSQTYILVLHEELWMGETLYHTLVNLNQLRHYGTQFQDNLVSESPSYIITEDGGFSMELSMEGVIVFSYTHTTSDKYLQECPHINIISPHPWDPMKVIFPKLYLSLEEELGGVCYISSMVASCPEEEYDD